MSLFDQFIRRSNPTKTRLNPQAFVRQVCQALERRKRQGVDGRWYVANAVTLRVAVHSVSDREHVRDFMDASDIADSLSTWIKQRNYRTRGPLQVIVEEISYGVPGDEPVEIHVRFEVTQPVADAGLLGMSAATNSVLPAEGVNVTPVVAPAPVLAVDPPVTDERLRPSPELGSKDSVPPATPQTLVKQEILVPHPDARRAYPYPEIDDDLHTVPAVPQAIATIRVTMADGNQKQVAVGYSGLRIGRSKLAGNDLVIADVMVSKRHVDLRVTESSLIIVDLQSTNGTRIGGAIIPPGIAWSVQEGDEFVIGNTRLAVINIKGAKLVPATSNYGVQPVYRALSLQTGDGYMHAIGSDMVIGRAISDDIVVTGVGVSPQHARLRTRHNVVTIEDLDAPSGTFVNNERIPPRHPVVLRGDETVALGACLMTVVASTVTLNSVRA